MDIKNTSAIFNYALILNGDVVKTKAEAIIGMSKPSDEYLKFEDERKAIIDNYSEKDENGNIVFTSDNWAKIQEDKKDEASAKIAELTEKYQDVL